MPGGLRELRAALLPRMPAAVPVRRGGNVSKWLTTDETVGALRDSREAGRRRDEYSL